MKLQLFTLLLKIFGYFVSLHAVPSIRVQTAPTGVLTFRSQSHLSSSVTATLCFLFFTP